MSQDFLVELGTEELPPTSLKALSEAFTSGIENALRTQNINFDSVQAFATPRRLATQVLGLAETTPKEEVKVWGPPAKIAFDKDGNPSKAAEAFAKKNGLTVADLSTENDGKQDKLVCISISGGESVKDLLAAIVSQSLAGLPIKKRMRWGSRRDEFVRPVQWLLMLLGDEVLDAEILGAKASNTTRGHRFHSQGDITITSVQSYATQLKEEGHVVVDYALRQNMIKEQVEAQAGTLGGAAVIDADLLDEVTGLVEWPVALAGKFEEEFLAVPAEALVSSMKEHQKYFHVVDKQGQLLPAFITVSNIESKDPTQVIDGNERVIRPRLADAAFFFDTDKKSSLADKREKLKTVVFQAQLGTIFDKTERIKALALAIAQKLGSDVNTDNISRAAELCKSDLVSAMVYEFTDLQGIAGYHYALHDGEQEDVALSMNEQYLPRYAGDALPSTTTGAIIALADRLDTITGIFGIGQKPTGSKDPFALRRASLGALRIMVEKSFALDLKDLVQIAADGFSEVGENQGQALPKADTVVGDVLTYMLERFKAWYEEENIRAEIFQSVNAKQLSTPLDINQRVHAVAAFTALPEAQALAAANKRVSNILAKLDSPISQTVDKALFEKDAEHELSNELERLDALVQPLFKGNEYKQALQNLAELRAPVDKFFDDVMVMADDEKVRDNRLALLNQLRALFLGVADISYLVVK